VVNSSDGTFKIIEMPEGTYDMIIRKSGFLSRKFSFIRLIPGETSFQDYKKSRGSSGDSFTILSQQNDPHLRIIYISFKPHTSEKEKQEIISSSRCTVNSQESLEYRLTIPENSGLSEINDFFLNSARIRDSTPDYLFPMN
jgi:hypothetical protein